MLTLASLTACGPRPEHVEPDDTAADPPCARVASDAGLRGHLIHIAEHTCLHPDDVPGLEDLLRAQYASKELACHTVWRTPSVDGWTFDGTAERVLDHASVPDVWIDPDGTHWLMSNDVTPYRLAQVASQEPERMLRQGMVGHGGLQLHQQGPDGGWTQVSTFDLGLDHVQIVVDPDLRQGPDGGWQLVFMQVEADELSPSSSDPAQAGEPHRIVRATSAGGPRFDPAIVVVEATVPNVVDPTVGRMQDGRTLILASQGLQDTLTLRGWWWEEGGPPATEPDASPGLECVLPDVVEEVDGALRMVAMVAEIDPLVMYRYTTEAGWVKSTQSVGLEAVINPSLAQAPDGGWWLYYNRIDADCLSALRD